ncbi:NmrA family NAD(P)-binding protein [Longispora albida]|uniref:NmrA family NAD(P)-binding protein n=1 Tax=Longispora albida TaxID=203523 RepID=UPI00037DB518|nr:NAD(P)H-binding protein [Longispora albida]
MTYLVTAATGRAGRHVVAELLRKGEKVRALTRDPASANLPPEVEVVGGDLTDPASLAGAFDGVTGVHLVVQGGDGYATLRTGPDIAVLAKRAGVQRVVVLWNGDPGPVEEAIAASGLPWSSLQPPDFMVNTLSWAASIKATGGISEPFGDVLSAAVHEADVGAASAALLVREDHSGQAYPLTGPEALSPRRKLAILGEAIGRDLVFTELTENQARERWQRAGHAPDLVDLLASWAKNPPASAYTVTGNVERLTGRPARDFASWAAEYASSFR